MNEFTDTSRKRDSFGSGNDQEFEQYVFLLMESASSVSHIKLVDITCGCFHHFLRLIEFSLSARIQVNSTGNVHLMKAAVFS